MTQIEQIKAEIERLKAEIPYHENAWSVLDKLKTFINSLHAEQPSEDLKKAAEEYASMSQIAYKGIHCTYVDDQHAFIAGADWQKEQMMKSAIEVKINRDTLYNLKPIIHEKYQDLKIGDKILIIKEDEQC